MHVWEAHAMKSEPISITVEMLMLKWARMFSIAKRLLGGVAQHLVIISMNHDSTG
jgi:hypothetical protein